MLTMRSYENSRTCKEYEGDGMDFAPRVYSERLMAKPASSVEDKVEEKRPTLIMLRRQASSLLIRGAWKMRTKELKKRIAEKMPKKVSAMDSRLNTPKFNGQEETHVLLINRESSGSYGDLKEGRLAELTVVRGALQSGRIVSGLEKAIYHELLMRRSFSKALPTNQRWCKTGKALRTFLDVLCALEAGAQVVIATLGIDGLSGNIEGWQAFIEEFVTRKGLKIYLLIGESTTQWMSNTIPLVASD